MAKIENEARNAFDSEIIRLISTLDKLDPQSEEYWSVLQRIDSLTSSRTKGYKVSGLSKDAILGAAVNLIGIGLVLRHEQFNVIASKAFSWIRKA